LRKLMLTILTFSLLLSTVLTSALATSYKTYRSLDFKLQITYPSTWSLLSTPTATTPSIKLQGEKPTTRLIINLIPISDPLKKQLKSISRGKFLEDTLAALITGMKRAMEPNLHVKFSQPTNTRVGGELAKVSYYEGKYIKGFVGVTMHNDKIYPFAFVSAKDDYPSTSRKALDILSRISFF